MAKQSITIKYKYRSVFGEDVSGTVVGKSGETKENLLKRLLQDDENSITPIVEIDGEKRNIDPFLCDIENAIEHRISAYQKDLKKIREERRERNGTP